MWYVRSVDVIPMDAKYIGTMIKMNDVGIKIHDNNYMDFYVPRGYLLTYNGVIFRDAYNQAYCHDYFEMIFTVVKAITTDGRWNDTVRIMFNGLNCAGHRLDELPRAYIMNRCIAELKRISYPILQE